MQVNSDILLNLFTAEGLKEGLDSALKKIDFELSDIENPSDFNKILEDLFAGDDDLNLQGLFAKLEHKLDDKIEALGISKQDLLKIMQDITADGNWLPPEQITPQNILLPQNVLKDIQNESSKELSQQVMQYLKNNNMVDFEKITPERKQILEAEIAKVALKIGQQASAKTELLDNFKQYVNNNIALLDNSDVIKSEATQSVSNNTLMKNFLALLSAESNAVNSSSSSNIQSLLNSATTASAITQPVVAQNNIQPGNIIQQANNSGIIQANSFLIEEPINTDAWNKVMASRVNWLVNENMKAATININPPELGPLRLKIDIQDNVANLLFNSTNDAAKQAIEHSHTQIRDILNDSGLKLSGFDVKTNQDQSNDQSSDESKPSGFSTSESERIAAEELTHKLMREYISDSSVNVYA